MKQVIKPKREREGEIEIERERERDKERDKERKRDRKRDKERKRDREIDRERERCRDSERCRESERDAERVKPSSSKANKAPSIPPKQKSTMPPIVIDGKTANHTGLINDLKTFVTGEFSVKHTNYTTILFVDKKEDYDRVLTTIKADNIAYHTYTSNNDKSHAFVLRGIAEGTKIKDIKENLDDEHEITAREIYQMNTKERPLFLVVTDPALTLDYLNKNTKRVLYTRVTWELRKSTKLIIQCHNCQQ
ncbi:unnamed protein product [Psylliodes chrysocephalus]|uniref:Uncharacterized protein n=1 Tax=Psylliodes chrysocephalus TaxID=3402493 RepID=A0A9P0CP49_9CUCU|nr:unnamed protein product [Psylliodes chrysocephala]